MTDAWEGNSVQNFIFTSAWVCVYGPKTVKIGNFPHKLAPKARDTRALWTGRPSRGLASHVCHGLKRRIA